jgi:hypothetical protein
MLDDRRTFLKKAALTTGALSATVLSGSILDKPLVRSSAVSAPPVMRGIGEDYQLHWSYDAPPPNIVTAWSDYFAMSDFQTYKAKFKWNLVRLGFYFSDVYNSSNDNPLNTSDFSLLDEVIAICSSNGLKVMLCDMNFTGSVGYDVPKWIQDWTNVVTHYKGNKSIYAFQIANEMENSDGNALANLLSCTEAVQQIDSIRLIAYWVYSIGNYARAPSQVLPANVLADLHIATYSGTRCQRNQQLIQWANSLKNYGMNYASGSIIGEINAQSPSCNPQTICLLSDLDIFGGSYICWGYNDYRTNWDAIFAAI